MTPQKTDTIVVWFSCGAASAVAALKTIEKYGAICDIRIVNNPIAEEHLDNRRFLRDVEEWLQFYIEECRSSKYPDQSCVDVWNDRKFMSGVAGAPCTLELKKKARQEWESRNRFDWMVLGFTAEEKHRYDRFRLTERENILPILIDEKITKSDCYQILINEGIRLPQSYIDGMPNANCQGCVKASSATYWNHVRKVYPDVFKQRSEQSREIGAKLVRVNGTRIFLDELSPDAKGAPMKDLDFECGIFCMEQPMDVVECDL